MSYPQHLIRCVVFIALVSTVLLSGCAAQRVGGIATVVEGEMALLSKTTAGETGSEKPDTAAVETGAVPEWGLAMSGGGTRSASFNIGVLHALQDGGVIQNLDYISSVSGGSYASYWFYSQNYYRDQRKDPNDDCAFTADDDIFRDSSISRLSEKKSAFRFQNHLENGSYILNYSRSGFFRALENVAYIAAHLVTVPVNWITHGLFDWSEKTNTSMAKIAYRDGLSRTYGLVPCRVEDGLKYANRSSKFPRIRAVDLDFSQLNTFLEERNAKGGDGHLPIPIINTTIGHNGEVDENLSESVFYFSPAYYGTSTGHFDIKTAPLKFSRAVAASGAAVDAQAREAHDFYDFGLFVIDGNLGYKIPTPGTSVMRRYAHIPLVFPLYYLDEGAYRRLSDGGHSENLGVYSLVVRQVKNIIVVDAEHDPQYVFDSLRHLAVRLEKENQYYLEISEDKKSEVLKKDSNEQSVVMGVICKHPMVEGQLCAKKDVVSNIYYLKLSMDMNKATPLENGKRECKAIAENVGDNDNTYTCSVVDFYAASRNGKSSNRFPHNSTADVFYNNQQFRAYRDLGYILTHNQLLKRLPCTVATKSAGNCQK